MRLTPEQYAALQKKGRTKYGSVKKQVGGRVFDSTKEAKRYEELLLLQHAGEIADLKCQQKIQIIVSGTYICDYVSDFVYYCRKRKALIHEDSKGVRTREYILKRKLVRATTGIEIVET